MDGEWVDNPYQKWSEIDDRLPDIDIVVVGPPPTSGTRDAWVELAMHAGCKSWTTSPMTAVSTATGSKRTARACAPTARSSKPAKTTT